jgi:UAA transporter family
MYDFSCMHTLQGRRYTGRDYLVVAMIVVGLVVFMHADVHTASSFDMRGVSLISIALCIDAAITNLQV